MPIIVGFNGHNLPNLTSPQCYNMPAVFLLLLQVLSSKVFVPERSASGPFVFSVDHCFPIRGQGTVMTGTVLSGSVTLNDVSSHNLSWFFSPH